MERAALRCGSELERTLATLGLRAAVAGTHPFAIWQEIAVSGGERYQFVYGSMRELARREPTFALHVHVGVADPETAIRVSDRMRVHLPLLLALSAQLALLAGPGLRARLGADAALPGVSPGRGARARSAATRPTPRRSTC